MTRRYSLLFISAVILLSSLGMAALLQAQEEETNLYSDTDLYSEIEKFIPDKQAAAAPQGQPDNTEAAREDIIYTISNQRGFLVSFDSGKSWSERNQGLPLRLIYPFDSARVRMLTSLATDPVNINRVVVTTAGGLFLSEDNGLSWQQIPIGKPLRKNYYLTSSALSPYNRGTILVGTSFNGFFQTRNLGKSWEDPSENAPFLYRGAGFYEEIAAVTYSPVNPQTMVFACGFGGDIYISSDDQKSWQNLNFPGVLNKEIVQSLNYKRPEPEAEWFLETRTDSGFWNYYPGRNKWRKSGRSAAAAVQERDLVKPNPDALKKFGIYISSYNARGEQLDKHINFLKAHGLNSMVVDFKEDFGWVTYNTRLDLPKKIGAVSLRINLEELLEKAHANNIYVIARLVVFKDRQLFNYDNHKYALKKRNSNEPWRYLVEMENEETGETTHVQREYWVDPFSRFVWEYNTAIARELQQRGVDEIQFDYIRFPSDGPLSAIDYTYQRQGMTKIDALESFLALNREAIHIPISTDLYGFNSWHRMGRWIGQSIELLADYVDVICPMFYPSHFPIDFIAEIDYLERAKIIYNQGTFRAASIAGERAIIRPYIQAFLIGRELEMSTLEYSTYLKQQLTGTKSAPSSGFTLWNASNRYYMVRESLQPFVAN